MTQPPDERIPPDGSGGPADAEPPEDQPTIAWSAPDPVQPSPEPPPAEPAPPPAEPAQPNSVEPPAETVPPIQPDAAPSPILSVTPPTAPQATGWSTPAVAPPGPIVGWEMPGPSPAAPASEGFVIAGVGARLVAWLIDTFILFVPLGVLLFFTVDFQSLFLQAYRAGQGGAYVDPSTLATPDLVLVQVITVAIYFLYFVGFWTSSGQATPGMRGLKLRVVDAKTGQTLGLAAAIKRFVAMGWWLGLLSFIPVLATIGSVASLILYLVLLVTTIAHPMRQGIHDRWADSLVIRHASSGDGATAVGCVVLVVLGLAVSLIFSVVALGAMAPMMEEILSDIGNSI
jgi:uncharacterized RDD family membrane protein YckC